MQRKAESANWPKRNKVFCTEKKRYSFKLENNFSLLFIYHKNLNYSNFQVCLVWTSQTSLTLNIMRIHHMWYKQTGTTTDTSLLHFTAPTSTLSTQDETEAFIKDKPLLNFYNLEKFTK